VRGWSRHLLTVLLAGLALSAFSPAPARAHAEILDVEPADSSVGEGAPEALVITFSEVVGVDEESIRVFDANGNQVDVEPEVQVGPTLRQPLSQLPPGWYLATWSVVSQDGHIVNAASTFGVGNADAASRVAVLSLRNSQAPAHWFVRFVADLSLVLTVGALFAVAVLGVRESRARTLALYTPSIAALSTAAWWCIEAVAGGSEWIGSTASVGGLVRVLILLVSAVVSKHRMNVSLMVVAAALLTMAAGGHPGSEVGTSLLLVAHLLGASLWIGAAPSMALALSSRAADVEELQRSVARFSRVATLTMLAAVFGGSLLGFILSDQLAGGLTSYTALLAGKLGLALVAVIGGAAARRRLSTSDLSRTSLMRLFVLDSGILLVVVALSAALTLGSPHQGHAGYAGSCRMEVGTSVVTVKLSPGKIGENLVLVTGLGPASAAQIEFTSRFNTGGQLSIPLSRPSAAWQGRGVIPTVGEWRATVVARVDQLTETRGGCTLEISP
jgi:copper transport protein